MHLYLGQRFSNLKAPSKSPGRLKKEHWASAPEFKVGRDGWGWEVRQVPGGYGLCWFTTELDDMGGWRDSLITPSPLPPFLGSLSFSL